MMLGKVVSVARAVVIIVVLVAGMMPLVGLVIFHNESLRCLIENSVVQPDSFGGRAGAASAGARKANAKVVKRP